MSELGQIVEKIRSKNAGPFWVTIDIFCGGAAAYDQVQAGLRTDQIGPAFHVALDQIKRFDIPYLNVVKFSLPRPAIQGTIADRDMHGAGWGPMIAELTLAI